MVEIKKYERYEHDMCAHKCQNPCGYYIIICRHDEYFGLFGPGKVVWEDKKVKGRIAKKEGILSFNSYIKKHSKSIVKA
jgi:hypothetical protein